ncbi:hypothetical protein FDP22_24125 (plasmid) [Paroceanicella profunda]|uniref:Uncharacterized protein n=1 Tax=Paroceanicella profunda TaxID=2579971 RepID=A0A5B8G4I4_9RHOB|nr:hypothetical protein [Paroceanicella profunda]QDL94950.1 hypothetical protein FDP22_24125 [Paroceanicella profunda]
MWELRGIGRAALLDGTGAPVTLRSERSLALIAYLALGPAASMTRERACGLFWGDRPEAAARSSLRQLLHRLKADLADAPDLLDIGRDSIALKEPLRTDLHRLCDEIAAGAPPQTLPEAEALLQGLESLSEEFDAWLGIVRQRWVERLLGLLSAALKVPGPVQIHAARGLFSADPTHDGAARILIQTALDEAALAEALRVYERHWDALDAEWDQEPAADLQDLVVRAKSGEVISRVAPAPARAMPRQAPAPAGFPPGPPVDPAAPPIIEIAPFLPAGPWTGPSDLPNGFRLELIAALVRFREWAVVEQSVGLDPDYRISGIFMDVGGRVRLTLTTIECRTGGYLYSDALELETDAWADIVTRTIRRVAISLNMHVSRRRLTAWDVASPESAAPGRGQAYDLWLRGNDLRKRWSASSFDEAEVAFRQLIKLEPGYAAAYSSLAGLLNTRHLAEPGIMRSPARAAAAREFAMRAVALDPLDGRNQHALAWSHALCESHELAAFHFDLSMELNPSSPRTLVPLAHGYSFLGQHDRALGLAAQAMAIHPQMNGVHWGYLMCIRYFAGDTTGALQAGEAAGDAVFDFLAWHAAALAMDGATVAARAKMEQFVAAAVDRWAGDGPADWEAIGRWLMHSFPIRRAEDLARLRTGLAAAGLPV